MFNIIQNEIIRCSNNKSNTRVADQMLTRSRYARRYCKMNYLKRNYLQLSNGRSLAVSSIGAEEFAFGRSYSECTVGKGLTPADWAHPPTRERPPLPLFHLFLTVTMLSE